MDEKKSEVVGKISICLLKVCNGEKKWYALKDSTLRERAKGNNPKILLEMNLYWNLVSKKNRNVRFVFFLIIFLIIINVFKPTLPTMND